MEAVAHKTRKGFNLIEAAIVLGVVGLVIGGIWIAAANMMENYRANKTVEGVFMTARNIQNLISMSDSVAMGNSINITNEVRHSGGFPKDWVQGSNVNHPFGGSVTSNNYTGVGSGERFFIRLANIPFSACVKMLAHASSIASRASQKGVAYGNVPTGNNMGALLRITLNLTEELNVFPISPTEAESNCSAEKDSNGVIANFEFVFSYTRVN